MLIEVIPVDTEGIERRQNQTKLGIKIDKPGNSVLEGKILLYDKVQVWYNPVRQPVSSGFLSVWRNTAGNEKPQVTGQGYISAYTRGTWRT